MLITIRGKVIFEIKTYQEQTLKNNAGRKATSPKNHVHGM
jgi:hypothetical protein